MKIRLLVLTAVWFAGCGDDDGGPVNANLPDAGRDAGDAGRRGDGGPRCDPLTDTGCPAGTKCALIQIGAEYDLVCGTGGGGTQGAACQTFASGDNCAAKFLCIRGPGAGSATCHAACDPRADMCPRQGTMITACQVSIPGVPGVRLCGLIRTCDPLTQTPCATPGEGCYVTSVGASSAIAQCLRAGAIQPGQSCTGMSAGACAPGSSCLDLLGGQSRCFFHCRVPSGAPMCAGAPTGGTNCVANPRVSTSFGTCQ